MANRIQIQTELQTESIRTVRNNDHRAGKHHQPTRDSLPSWACLDHLVVVLTVLACSIRSMDNLGRLLLQGSLHACSKEIVWGKNKLPNDLGQHASKHKRVWHPNCRAPQRFAVAANVQTPSPISSEPPIFSARDTESSSRKPTRSKRKTHRTKQKERKRKTNITASWAPTYNGTLPKTDPSLLPEYITNEGWCANRRALNRTSSETKS
jgi:hypothetical protein